MAVVRSGHKCWITLLLCTAYLIPGLHGLTDDVTNEFLTHDVIRPTVTPSNTPKTSRNRRQIDEGYRKYADNLVVNYTAFGEDFILDLHINKNLLPQHYFEKIGHEGKYIVDKPYNTDTTDHCYYQGEIRNKADSWAAVSLCNGISGMIFDGNEAHYIEPKSSVDHFVFKASDVKEKNLKCGFTSPDMKHNMDHFVKLARVKRDVSIVREPYRSNSESRFVELVIVNDNLEYKERNSSKEQVFARSKQIANIVNSLYAPLNIFIALVGVIIWTESDQIKISSDGDATLTNFLHYRRQKLVHEHPNDNAQLITAIKFDGGVVGKALKGPICTWEFSGGVNMDHSRVVALVATTVAHEIGHNFGMEHDSDECKCKEEKCIMSPSSGNTSPKSWSSCSKVHLTQAYDQGMDYCLRNLPERIDGPVCGNGYLEDGEECDCGYKEFCDNKCCNATSCKLIGAAQCATGSCCNIETCKYKRAASICREAGTECDLPEFCDGMTEFCPHDVYLQDGVECGNGKAYCYEGLCRNHDDQCRILWGPSGHMSEDKCYEQNQNGNDNGNCGFFKPNKTHKACSRNDVFCGRLHCIHLNERLEFGMESAATLAHSFIQHKGKTVICRSATVDLGLANSDPGLAPTGAKCGVGKACYQQSCQPVAVMKSPDCPFECNYNGLCNNKGNCHCIPGLSPPFCDTTGPGGSLDSGPATDPEASYQFLVAMYVIFLCIVPLTAIAAFGIYYFRRHLKTWWISKARKAAIKSRAKQATQRKPRPPSSIGTDLRNVEISAPLPTDPNPISATSTLSRSSSGRGTLSRGSFRAMDISSPIPQSCTNETVNQLVPIRPAPAAPPRHQVQRTPSWAPGSGANGFATVTRSASVRATSIENGRPLSGISRPHCPPPPRPPPPVIAPPPHYAVEEARSNTPNSLCNGTLDFSDTPLAFVHKNATTIVPSMGNNPKTVPNGVVGVGFKSGQVQPTYGNIGWGAGSTVFPPKRQLKETSLNRMPPVYANTPPVPPPSNTKPNLVTVGADNNSTVASLTQRFEKKPNVSSFRPMTARSFQPRNT